MRLILFFCGMLLLASCRKEKQIFISAKNPVDGSGYAGLSYRITEDKTGAFEEKVKVFHEGVLDQNGEAALSLKFHKNRGYTISCQEPANTCYNKSIQYGFGWNELPDLEFNFEFAPCSMLKLDIENINCLGVNDSIRMQRFHSYSEPVGWTTYFTGCYQLESDYFEVSSGWMYYRWQVIRNNVMSEYLDSAYLAPSVFTTFEIHY